VSAQLDRDENPVPKVEEFHGIESKVLEAFKHLAPNLTVTVMTVEDRVHVGHHRNGVKFNAGIKTGDEKIEVAPIRRRVCLAKTTHEYRSAQP